MICRSRSHLPPHNSPTCPLNTQCPKCVLRYKLKCKVNYLIYQDKLENDQISNYFDKNNLNILEPIKYSSTMSLTDFVYKLCEEVKNENIDHLIESNEHIENESLSSGDEDDSNENMLLLDGNSDDNPYAFLENQSFTWTFVSPVYNNTKPFISNPKNCTYGPILSKRIIEEDLKLDIKRSKIV